MKQETDRSENQRLVQSCFFPSASSINANPILLQFDSLVDKHTYTHMHVNTCVCMCLCFNMHSKHSPLPALAFCHSDRQSVLMKAPLIHKPALSTFDARQLSEGKKRGEEGERKDRRGRLLSFSFFFLHYLKSSLENEPAKFRFVNPWLVFVVTHMIKDHALSCPNLWLSLTQ